MYEAHRKILLDFLFIHIWVLSEKEKTFEVLMFSFMGPKNLNKFITCLQIIYFFVNNFKCAVRSTQK